MVIDSSALIAILSNEVESVPFAAAIEADLIRMLSAASLLETAIVIEARHGLAGAKKLDELVEVAQISIEPISAANCSCTHRFPQVRKGSTRRGVEFR